MQAQKIRIKTGIEVLKEQNFRCLEGKRVGLITNPTGVDNRMRSTIDILHEAPNVNLVALYGPEHGVRGDVHAGDHVTDIKDATTGLPVYSLYGKTRKATPDMLKDVDVLVYDIQDIGCRSFTYISTMGLAMEAAAENGKEVVALVELRARFDEQNNIDWSKQLESAGCTVIYGFEDYKVHSKLTLITRKGAEGYSYITQIGTGNYNEKTSELYTDYSFITADERIGEEASKVFRNLAVQQLTEESDKMLVAPLRFKSVLLDEMDHVIAAARMGRPASMILKNNSISDRDIILKLQEASCAGVRIDMIVRGICCVRAEVPGKTENLHIRSLVGRYLEHGRIYSFFDGTHTRIYIASGDFLTRNTECRVEVGVRVEDPVLVQKLTDILQLQLRDNVNARVMDASGNYQKVKPAEGEPLVNSQMGMYELLRNDWQRLEPWKCTTPATETEKTAAVCQEVTVEQLKQELPHVFQPAPEKAEKAAPAAQQPDHYEALEQMLNNKPRAAQPASKAPATPRPAVKPVVTAPKKKSLLERIGSFFRR